jgi:hypothetical protein
MSLLQMLSQVNGERVLYEFTDFAHGVGKSLKLKGNDLGDGVQDEPLPRIGTNFALLAEILIGPLQFLYGEETGHALKE